MKIGFDAKRMFFNFRGLGNYSRTLLEGLLRFYPENQYYLYSPVPKDLRGVEWYKRFSGLELVTPSSSLSKMMATSWRSLFLSRVIKKNSLDIFHGPSHELPPGIEKLKLKKIVTIHDLLFMRYPQFFPWLDRQVYRKKFTYSCQVADVIVAICQQTKNDIVEFLGISPEKIEVVYQSCNSLFHYPLFFDQKGKIQEKYQLPDEYVLYVGALEENKNVAMIVEALPEIDLPLVIVGRGKNYKKTLLHQIKKLNLTKRVLFLEDVSTADLPGIYQNATIFVFPSFFEGFGIPIIEALFSGVPVITTQGHCFPESGGPSSIYIDPHRVTDLAAALRRVQSDLALRKQMITNGREYAERFLPENTSKRLMEVYRAAVTD